MPEASKQLVVGVITSAHGIKGWVKIKPFTESVGSFKRCGTYWMREPGNKPAYAIKFVQLKTQGKMLIGEIDGVTDRNQAETLRKSEILVVADTLPSLGADEFYWHQLEGLQVVNESDNNVLLGVVDHLLETGSNDVLVVKPCAGSIDQRERLLPYRPEVVLGVDLAAKTIAVDWQTDF